MMDTNESKWLKLNKNPKPIHLSYMVQDLSSIEKSTGDRWSDGAHAHAANKSAGRLLSSHAGVAGTYLSGEPFGVAMP